LSAPAPVFTAPQRTEWRLVWLLVATSLSLALHIGKVPPSLPALRSDFGLSLSAAGWLVSIVNLTGAAGALLLALGADRLGFARLIGIGAALAAVGSALAASFANVPLLLVCRFFEGMGFILVSVSVPSLMLRIASPRDLRLVLSLWSAFVPAGAGSMMIIAAALPGHGAWRLLWYGAAMASAAASVAIFLATRRAPALTRSEMAAPAALAGIGEVITTPGVLLLGLCFALYAGSWYSLISFLPILQTDQFGFSVSSAALVTALVVVSNVAGNVSAGVLLQRGVPRHRLMAGTALVMCLASACLFLDLLPDTTRLISALIFSMVGGMLPGSIFASVPRFCPRPALLGIASGVVTQCTNIGSLLGPPTTGALVAWGGWPSASWLTITALGLVVILASLLGRLEAPAR
jgi:MFS family permease